jgi:hypothetical protein
VTGFAPTDQTWRVLAIVTNDLQDPNLDWIKSLADKHLTTLSIKNDLARLGPSVFVAEVNNAIESYDINLVIIVLHWGYTIDLSLLRNLDSRPLRLICSYDSHINLERDLVLGSKCDLIAVSDTLLQELYANYNLSTTLAISESSQEIFFDSKVKRDIDIFFSGYVDKESRPLYLDALASCFPGNNVLISDSESNPLTFQEYAVLLNQSKIVLNFSQGFLPRQKQLHGKAFYAAPYPRTFKGRIISSSLCGAACVSEYFAAGPKMFPDLLMFRRPDEMIRICETLLGDESLRIDYAHRMNQWVTENYAESRLVARLSDRLQALLEDRRRYTPLVLQTWSRHYAKSSVRDRVKGAQSWSAILDEFSWQKKLPKCERISFFETFIEICKAIYVRTTWNLLRTLGPLVLGKKRWQDLRRSRNTFFT